MQTKDQWKRAKDWKVVGAVAAASALGLSGLALAGPDASGSGQGSIELEDQASFSTVPTTVPTTVADAIDRVADSADLDSPFVDDTTTGDSSPSSPQTASVQSPQGEESVQSPQGQESPDSPQSPASPQPEPESPDSPESPASPQPEPESPDSPQSGDDESADTGDDGSADS